MNKANKVKILSIDGGGLRGIAPLLILKQIEIKTGKRIHELFDIIVGTSTGGIIACGLTATKDGVNPHLSIDDMIMLYTTKGNEIFPYKSNFISKSLQGINSIFNPKHSAKGLDRLLIEYFEDLKLSDTLIPIIVSSYDIKNNEILMFKSRKSCEEDCDINLKDVCRATSAAPTYLASYKLNYNGKERICVDGGVYINNPTLAGVSDLRKFGHNGKKVLLKNISCLSLGTGNYTKNLGHKTTNWGILNWVKPITSVMMQGSSNSIVYQSEMLINNYIRVDFTIGNKKKSDMDDSRKSTTDYVINRVQTDILDDEVLMNEIYNYLN